MDLRSGQVYKANSVSSKRKFTIKNKMLKEYNSKIEWPTVELVQERIKFVKPNGIINFIRQIIFESHTKNVTKYDNRYGVLCATELICKYPQVMNLGNSYCKLLDILINKLEEATDPLPWDGYITKLQGLATFASIPYPC